MSDATDDTTDIKTAKPASYRGDFFYRCYLKTYGSEDIGHLFRGEITIYIFFDPLVRNVHDNGFGFTLKKSCKGTKKT